MRLVAEYGKNVHFFIYKNRDHIFSLPHPLSMIIMDLPILNKIIFKLKNTLEKLIPMLPSSDLISKTRLNSLLIIITQRTSWKINSLNSLPKRDLHQRLSTHKSMPKSSLTHWKKEPKERSFLFKDKMKSLLKMLTITELLIKSTGNMLKKTLETLLINTLEALEKLLKDSLYDFGHRLNT